MKHSDIFQTATAPARYDASCGLLEVHFSSTDFHPAGRLLIAPAYPSADDSETFTKFGHRWFDADDMTWPELYPGPMRP